MLFVINVFVERVHSRNPEASDGLEATHKHFHLNVAVSCLHFQGFSAALYFSSSMRFLCSKPRLLHVAQRELFAEATIAANSSGENGRRLSRLVLRTTCSELSTQILRTFDNSHASRSNATGNTRSGFRTSVRYVICSVRP